MATISLGLVVSTAACGREPVAPQTSAPAGFTVVSDAETGFAIAVPSGWQRIPLTPDLEVFERNANRIRLQNPKLTSIIESARVIAGSGGKLLASDQEGAASVNLTVDKSKEETVDEVVAKVRTKLESDGASNLTSGPATVAGLPAVRLSFRFPVQTDAGDVQTDEIQYYLLKDGKAYILTVLGAGPDVAEAISATLRLR